MGEVVLHSPNVTVPPGAMQLFHICISPPRADTLHVIAKLIRSAGTTNHRPHWPMPINDWWKEGSVECKEEGWQEMLDILPWLMLQVCAWVDSSLFR